MSKDMDRHALLNGDDDDGCGWIREFYAENLEHFMTIPMPHVDDCIIRNTTVLLESTSLWPKYSWQEFATKMGVTNHLTLAKIKAGARAHKDQELYLTLKLFVPNKMFGHLIIVLLNLKRYDVLKEILPDVKNMLERISKTDVKEIASIHNPLFEFKAKELTSGITLPQTNSYAPSSSSSNIDRLNILAPSPASLNRHVKEEIPLQQSHFTDKDITAAFQNISVSSELSREENNSIQEINLLPAGSDEERVSVFIQHSEDDIAIARDLSAKLRQGGLVVVILSDMEDLIAGDNTREALRKMFQQVDFLVPIVSESLLKQIHSHEDSLEVESNKLLYQLCMNEYMINKCINFRVRPVIVPNMNRQLLINDIILSYSFKLWGEVPKLIRILKETKKKIQEYNWAIR